MKSKTIVSIAVVLALIIALSPAAMARGFGKVHGPGRVSPEFTGLRTVMDLNLSDTQREKLSAIFEKYDHSRDEVRENLSKAREELAILMHEGEFDEQKVRQAHQKVSTIREDLYVLRGKFFTEVRTVLTPEQTALMKERRSDRFERRADRLERWPDRRDSRRGMWDNRPMPGACFF